MCEYDGDANEQYYDSKFVTRGEGREVTRVQKTGTVKVQLNVITKGMQQFGYVSQQNSGTNDSFANTNRGLGASMSATMLASTQTLTG